MQGHGELLNEGVEILGGLPAVLEETGCLLRVIKMQTGEMEEKRGFLEKLWQEIMAIPSLVLALWLPGYGDLERAQQRPSLAHGVGYPNYLGCLACRIGLLFNPSSTHWGVVLPKATFWGVPGPQSQSKTCF